MAKCIICNSRKGKRKCRASEAFICSLCCGTSRNIEKCGDCSFIKSASDRRNYKQVPYYTTQEMADSFELDVIARSIESALYRIWNADIARVNDKTAARLVEVMLDNYHFNDTIKNIDDNVLATAYQELSLTIKEELSTIPVEKIVKVLATIYRSIQRRTNGGTSYLEFVSDFVGFD